MCLLCLLAGKLTPYLHLPVFRSVLSFTFGIKSTGMAKENKNVPIKEQIRRTKEQKKNKQIDDTYKCF